MHPYCNYIRLLSKQSSAPGKGELRRSVSCQWKRVIHCNTVVVMLLRVCANYAYRSSASRLAWSSFQASWVVVLPEGSRCLPSQYTGALQLTDGHQPPQREMSGVRRAFVADCEMSNSAKCFHSSHGS